MVVGVSCKTYKGTFPSRINWVMGIIGITYTTVTTTTPFLLRMERKRVHLWSCIRRKEGTGYRDLSLLMSAVKDIQEEGMDARNIVSW